jgi:heptosyltransferase I
MPGPYGNILIIKPSALGDIVLALPALSALRRSFPNAQISWLVRPEFAPLLEGHPYLSRTIHFDRRSLGRAWFRASGLRELTSLIHVLRSSHFDAVVDLQGLLRTACLARCTGCPERYGMANSREGAWWFYNHRVKQDAQCIHLVDYYLRIVGGMGASDLHPEFVLPASSQADEAVGRLLAASGVGSGTYVVMVPASSDRDKCWPADRFAAVADRIATDYGLAVVACGTRGEEPVIKDLQGISRARVVNLAGRTSLAELVSLLRRARLVISNDTGPGHIAAGLGVPLVMLFSWSNPARIAPYGRPECMVAREPYGRGMRIKSRDPAHLVRNIGIDEVYEKVRQQLGRGRSRC